MTAQRLIDDIFSRVQPNLPGNMRRVTQAQYNYLRDLILEEAPAAEVRNGLDGSLVWMPAGRGKYVLGEELARRRWTLTRLANLSPSGAGSLF